MKTPVIKTKRLLLRNLTPKDAKEYSKIGISYHTTGPINTLIKAKKHITKTLKTDEGFEWGLFLKETNELIGIIELDNMHWFNFQSGEMSRHIIKQYQRKGFGNESATALINYCFNKMKLHKIYADTTPDNIGSQKSLEALGFKLEGRIRDRRKKGNKWVDELDYGLLKKEWKS